MKTIATMSTLPSRIDLIRPAVEHALNQTIEVSHLELNLPYHCIRTGEEYLIPPWLKEHPKVHLHRTPDFGPITKIAPTLLRYRNRSDVRIWSVDDDIAYAKYELSLLAQYFDPGERRIVVKHALPFDDNGAVHGIHGTGYIPILEGYGGVLYPANCIEDDFEPYVISTSMFPDCRLSDDILLSHYFARHGVALVINNRPEPGLPFYPGRVDMGQDPRATSKQGAHADRYWRVQKFLEKNWDWLTLPPAGIPWH